MNDTHKTEVKFQAAAVAALGFLRFHLCRKESRTCGFKKKPNGSFMFMWQQVTQ